jgi:hypothetical protein
MNIPDTTNDKGHGCDPVPFAKNTTKKSKSTASEAQRARIMEALREGPKTSYALRLIGCYQAPARIKELRDKYHFNIETERVILYDHQGYMHQRAARYHLHEMTVRRGAYE